MQELKLYVKTLLNSHFHFYWLVFFRFWTKVLDDEFFLFGDSIVAAINDYIDVVSESHNYAIVRLKLFFYSIEWKVISHIVC